MRKTLGLICLLALTVTVLAAVATAPRLKLHKGALTNRYTIPLVGGFSACTTQFIDWSTQPTQALGFGLYANSAADTWTIVVTYKWTAWPNGSGPFDWRTDTVVSATISGVTDTLRTLQRHWAAEYDCKTSQGGFFIFTQGDTLVGIADTMWVDSVVFNGYGS